MPNSPSKFISAPLHLRPVMWWKSWGVTVISLSAIWKVWVVFKLLSAKVCTNMVLANLSGSKRMIGSKPAAWMWPLVSQWESDTMYPLGWYFPYRKTRSGSAKKREKDDVRFTMRWKMKLGLQLDTKMMKKDVRFAIGWEIDEKGVQNIQNRVSVWWPACVWTQEQICMCMNRPAYAWIQAAYASSNPRMHKHR